MSRIKILYAAVVGLTLAVGLQGVYTFHSSRRIVELEQAVHTYEERQQSLISQDKAIRQEIADLKRYVQNQGKESAGG